MRTPECVLIADDFLPHLGGSRIYYHMVASRLAPRLAVVTRARGGGREFDEEANYVIRRVALRGGKPGGPTVIDEAANCASLIRAAAEAFPSAQCFLAGEVNPSAFAAAILAGWRAGAFGVVLHDEPLMGAGAVEATVRRRVLRRAEVIITSSSFPERQAREIVGEEVRIFPAPPGVDMAAFSPGPVDRGVLERYAVRAHEYLLCVGRLVKYKNVGAVVEALAELSDAKIRLVVVGEGPERAPLEGRASELGVAGRVIFAGRLEKDELAQLYRGALAYVFPSQKCGGRQHEGIGMAALEAAACACAVIASTATSAGDFVEEGVTGTLFDPEERGALVRAIRTLVEEPDFRKRTAAEAARKVREKYTWENTANAVGRALDEMRGR